jgi:hypothetical protein
VYIRFLITKIKCLLNDRQSQGREGTYNAILKHVRVTTVAVEEEKSVTYSECVFVALVIHQGKRMRRIILSSMESPALPYLSTLSHNSTIFGKSY